MRIQVRLFATYREIVGSRQLDWSGKDGATLGDLVDRLLSTYPRLAGRRDTMLLAVNHAFAEPSTVLRDGDEVALMPPVSGGAG